MYNVIVINLKKIIFVFKNHIYIVLVRWKGGLASPNLAIYLFLTINANFIFMSFHSLVMTLFILDITDVQGVYVTQPL